MKKGILYLGFLVAGAFLIPSQEAHSTEGETVVICPQGDNYTCYTKDGLIVYKGKGKTEVIIR